MSSRIPRIVEGHAETLAVLTVALLVTLLEVVLLNAKYEAFSGGFLQSHELATGTARAVFVAEILLLHVCAFSALGVVWFRLARAAGMPRATRLLDWFAGTLLLSSVVTSIRYQIHSYFGDFLTFAIAKNLGGGSVSDALRYVADEATLVVVGLVAFVVAYALARRFVARRWQLGGAGTGTAYGGWTALVATLATVGVMALVSQNETMWYHMRRANIHFALDRTLDALTDFDRDGFGLFSFPKDPAPFDASIFPGALDVPGNGKDEDGFFGDFSYVERPAPSAQPVEGRHPNIFLIVLESTRADVLEAVAANGQPVMPVLRQLAAQGTHSDHYFSHTGYTTSSIKSIFSGSVAESAPPLLLPALKRGGYDIHIVSGQDEQFGEMAEATGAKELATTFFDARSAPEKRVFSSSASGSLALSNTEVTSEVERVAGAADWSRPQFFYVNLQAAHFPYFHPGMPTITIGQALPRNQLRRENLAAIRETYLNAGAYNDQAIGRLVEMLRGSGRWADTLLVVVGDHGESLFDDGYLGHGFIVSPTQLRTVFAANRRLSIPKVFGHADLAPILLSNAGFRVQPERDPEGAVFHYVGTLDRPSTIGLTLADRTMVTFNPTDRRGTFSPPDPARPEALRYPPGDSARGPALKSLVLEWERLRWETELNRRRGPRASKSN